MVCRIRFSVSSDRGRGASLAWRRTGTLGAAAMYLLVRTVSGCTSAWVFFYFGLVRIDGHPVCLVKSLLELRCYRGQKYGRHAFEFGDVTQDQGITRIQFRRVTLNLSR